MKIQALESPWKLQWVLESPWISVLTLSNLDFHVPKRSKRAERPSNCSCCQTELKIDIHSSLFFASNGVLEKWEMCPWKVLEFFVQKRVQTVTKNSHTTLLYSYQVIIHFSFHLIFSVQRQTVRPGTPPDFVLRVREYWFKENHNKKVLMSFCQ